MGAPLTTATMATSSASPEWTQFVGVALERVSALFQEEGFLLLLNGSNGKESACNAGDTGDAGSIPGSGRSPGVREWQPTPVFLPGEPCHGQRSLAGCSPEGRTESDTTEQLTLTLMS